MVTSTCQASFGARVRSPTFGLAGCKRSRGRRQPRWRISLPQVPGVREHLADALRVERKAPDGHVAVLGGLDAVAGLRVRPLQNPRQEVGVDAKCYK
jgi:hypothetical protein